MQGNSSLSDLLDMVIGEWGYDGGKRLELRAVAR